MAQKISWPRLHHCVSAFGLRAVLMIAFVGVVPDKAIPQAGAADTPTAEIDYPLGVINAASIQQLRDKATVMFEAADRSDLLERVDQWMTETLKDTKGIDRNRPFGVMFYLRPDFFGPLRISYLPVANLEEALATLAYGKGTVVPVEGRADRFDIQFGDNSKIRVLHRFNYLFLVTPEGDDRSLDREFPDPERMTTRLSSQYDIAASLMIKTIPEGLKMVFLSFMKTQLMANLQQRDDEPESVYRLRRASGEGWVDLLDKIVTQGEDFILGSRIDADQKSASIDLEIAGSKNSKLAKFFQTMAGKKTYFGSLLANPATLTVSASLQLEEKQRKLFVTFFESAQRDFTAQIGGDDQDELQVIMAPIFQSLVTSAEVGHLDAFLQCTGAEKGEVAVVAGVKVATARELPKRLTETLEFSKDTAADGSLATKWDLNMDVIDSHPVHRLPFNAPEKIGQRLFGETANLYLYANPDVVWCAYGGGAALGALKDAVLLAAAPQDPVLARNRIPLQFMTHAKNWQFALNGDDQEPSKFSKRTEASFQSDNDGLTIEVRPTDNGVRIRTAFESGFVALMGRGFSAGIDDGFPSPPPRGQGARRRGQNKPDSETKQPEPQN
ncbi:hypothetical protein [Schlesneria paludicola]|uniref:hypothetical protein n=1 Tax=Schlesneria paludicola TaxID=360056 RepID=UPI0012FC1B0F|nr:hypothetical protein [Schlesneria paludicola]